MIDVAPQVKLRESWGEISGGSTTPEEFGGADVDVTTGATLRNAYFVEEEFSQTLEVANDSGNTDISDYPNLTEADDYEGHDVVILSRGNYGKRLNLNFRSYIGPTTRQVAGITEDETYLRYSYEWLSALVAGDGQSAVYSSAARNASCWAASEDLTGIPYSNSTGGAQRNGVLIAPRYLAGAHHWPIAVGSTVTFKTSAGADVNRTVIGVSETGVGPGDLRICCLDSDVPAEIKVYPVAGRWVMNTVSNSGNFDIYAQYCALWINQNRSVSFIHACDDEVLSYAKRSATIGGIAVTDYLYQARLDSAFTQNKLPEFLALSDYRINPTYGDSGSALLVPVASGLAAVSVFTSPQGGPFFDEAFINACIASARLDAIARGNGTPALQTVTVAPDPTA